MAVLYTIGHSTRTLEELTGALGAHQIQMLADIRAFPISRRLPQFNRDSLEQSLPAVGIQYRWMQALGGYRKKIFEESPNLALRNQSFRNYADYMFTPEFDHAMAELLAVAENLRTAYMCAERLYFRCHRMLVSDWLVAHGHEVLHVNAEGPAKAHTLMPEARIMDGRLIYRGDRLL